MIHKNRSVFNMSGAARFHSSHLKLLTLIDDLGLSKNKFKLPSMTDTILRTKK